MAKRIAGLFCAVMLFAGCGISKDVYQKTVEESESRKAMLEQIQQEVRRLEDENRQLNERIDGLSKQLEESLRQIEGLSEQNEELLMQNEELGSEKEVLSELQQRIEEDMNVLYQEREELAEKNAHLEREIERLSERASELSEEKEREADRLKNAYENLMHEMKEEIDKGEIKITQALDRLSVNMVEKILFDSGKAEIKPEGLKVLNRVGTILKDMTDKQIRIEGHTDNVKIGARLRETYPTNWELSTARATNVARYLQDTVGLDPRLLSAAGYSEYRPIASNDTTDGRAQNRRMEIVLLPLDIGEVLEELKKD